MVTLSPPTSEAGVQFPARPQMGKLVVAWQFTVQNPDELYVLVSSEAGVRFPARPQMGKLLVARQFTVQNPDELYVLVSSALPTTRRDMTCTVLKAT